MNAGMVRTGGILALVLILVMIVGAFLVSQSRVGQIVLNLITTAIVLFVFWTTKSLFNALGYGRANLPIIVLMVIMALLWIVGLFGGQGMQAMMMGGGQTALGVIGIIALIIMLVMFVFWIWFGFGCIGFGSAGGGIWKAVGILYLVATGVMVLGVVLLIIGAAAKSTGLLGGGGVVAFIGMLVLLAGWICHAIGLILGAGKMQA